MITFCDLCNTMHPESGCPNSKHNESRCYMPTAISHDDLFEEWKESLLTMLAVRLRGNYFYEVDKLISEFEP